MVAGELYLADDPRIVAEQAEAHRLMDAYNSTPTADGTVRDDLLRRLLGWLGQDAVLRGPLHVDFGFHLAIGDRTFVIFGLTALDVAPIAIGDDSSSGRTSSCSPRSTRWTPPCVGTSGSGPPPSPWATTSGSAAG